MHLLFLVCTYLFIPSFQAYFPCGIFAIKYIHAMSYYPDINHQNNTKINRVKDLTPKLLIYLGFSSFFISLFLTSFFTSGDDIQGYWVLIIGWIGLIFFQLAWFANPINLLAILLIKHHPRKSLLLSLLAFSLASQTFLFPEIPIGLPHDKIFIKELGLGFYFWYLAQALFLLATLSKTVNNTISHP